MWTRKISEERERTSHEEESSKQSPKNAFVGAGLISTCALVGWGVGCRKTGPSDPKSWDQFQQFGPVYFAVFFIPSFLALYLWQRFTNRSLLEPAEATYLCPLCHTPQSRHARRCACTAPLEPLRDWKWVEPPAASRGTDSSEPWQPRPSSIGTGHRRRLLEDFNRALAERLATELERRGIPYEFTEAEDHPGAIRLCMDVRAEDYDAAASILGTVSIENEEAESPMRCEHCGIGMILKEESENSHVYECRSCRSTGVIGLE
jgi:hypothetical protein